MHERIRFVTYKGKQILSVDMSRSSPSEVEEIARRKSPDVVTVQPACFVLMLVDLLLGAKFDEAAIRTMQESAVFDKPYIKVSAWIGSEALPKVFYDRLTTFSRRDFPAFTTRLTLAANSNLSTVCLL